MPILRRFLTAGLIVCRQRVQRSSRWTTPVLNHVCYSSQLAQKMAPKLLDQISSMHDIVKSESDKNDYRGLVLKNGMKVLLVSDPSTDKAAAALSVQVGSLTDPPNLPGLAHFCEHMLFLGTKKYPRENQYQVFLSEHAGIFNAYTASDHTCYYFDVAPEYLKEAADIFAQFFLEPLFDQDCTDRELNAVDSEHEKNIKQDLWRLFRLESVTADPTHDFAKFGTGNRQTLQVIPNKNGIDVRKELLNFHDTWYSSNIMSLCMLGKENLDDLSDMAIELFGGVKNKLLEPPMWPNHPFTDKYLRLLVKVVPVKDLRQMIIAFPVPDTRNQYRTNPSHYISHLVGHEGEGSLLSYLKRKGWVNSLFSGVKVEARGFGLFTISMNLSPEGLEHTDEIADAIFQYLNLLRREGPQSWVFEELKNLGIMQFRFKPKETPIKYVPMLTEFMHDYDWKDVLSAPYLVEDYKPELITEFLSYLVPEKVRIALVSKNFEGQTDQKEEFYSTEYKVESIPDSKITAWKAVQPSPELHLPVPNEFIPTNFALAPENPQYTQTARLLVDKPHERLWFMQDKEYRLPTNMAAFELRSPVVYQDPLSHALSHLSIVCFKDANNEYFYPAVLAGSSYGLENRMYGLILQIRGYNERQQAILERICERLVNFKIDPNRFNVLKEAYIRTLRDFAAEQPYQHAMFYAKMALTEKFWTHEQVLAVAEKECTLERCEAFLQDFLKKFYLEGLIHGNMTADEAQKMGDTIRRMLKSEPLTFDETKGFREHKLCDGELYQLDKVNEVHPTNAVMIYYQIGQLQNTNDDELHMVALNDLFCQIIEEPCFDTLRSKEQLGYIVQGRSRRDLDTYGVRVFVQSDRHPSYVSNRIDLFINVLMKKHLEEMPLEEFEKHKQALIALKLEKPKQLYDRSKLLLQEISNRTYLFNRRELEAAEIAKLTKDEVLEFFGRFIARDGRERRQLIVNVESTVKPGEPGEGVKPTRIITDIEKFKSEHGFFETPNLTSPAGDGAEGIKAKY
ncbi:insulin-degrading enzyme-like [Tropilaelaps mercedesae]|uniref:Insulin-degrading enzyme-like n=1 Tax=Tropilaelaps mercedesae TaxID=418985 RepID=A0A1V9XP05_9ACAR|nr:insulin-degrading enzyme-like [Tropilaelaps mercedesae]